MASPQLLTGNMTFEVVDENSSLERADGRPGDLRFWRRRLLSRRNRLAVRLDEYGMPNDMVEVICPHRSSVT